MVSEGARPCGRGRSEFAKRTIAYYAGKRFPKSADIPHVACHNITMQSGQKWPAHVCNYDHNANGHTRSPQVRDGPKMFLESSVCFKHRTE